MDMVLIPSSQSTCRGKKHPAAQSLIFSLAKARHDIKEGCKGTLMH